jgi:hypothetical protein
MRMMTKTLAATMFLLAAWTALGLTGIRSALTEPPNPCLEFPGHELCL